MGGYRGWGNGWRPHIESAKAFGLDGFKKRYRSLANLHTSGVWVWCRGKEKTATVAYHWNSNETEGELVLSYNVDGEPHQSRIRVVTRAMRFGGVRWYMVCPVSGRRASKLYLFPGLTQFVHREAIRPRPTYAIQRKSGLDKIIQQRWGIRHRLGCGDWDDLSGVIWDKPKGMHWSTFKRYQQRDRELMEQELGLMSEQLRAFFPMDLGSEIE